MGWTWWRLGNRPALFPVVALLAGAAIAAETRAPPWLFLVLGGVSGASARWREGRSLGRALMLATAFFLGACLGALHSDVTCEIDPQRAAVVEGEVEAVRDVEGGRQVLLAVSRLDGAPARFRAQLFGIGAEPLEPGQRVMLEGRLKPVVPASNPGEWSSWRRALLRGQPVVGSFEGPRLVRVGPPPRWRQWLTATHGALDAETRRLAPSDDAAALFLTLSAGLRATLDEQLEEDFARSGLAHVLSVSGLHVAVLAFALFNLLRFVFVRWPGRFFRRVEPRRVAAPLSLPITWAYVVFTGLQAPAIRSAVMCSVLLLGHTARRRSDGLNALALAGAVMIVLEPAGLFDLSLQLSFSAVLALVLLTPTLRALLPIPVPSPTSASGLRLRLWRWSETALTTALASVSVTLVSAPLVAGSFQRLGVAGLVSNVVALPLSGALTLLAAASAGTFVVAPTLAAPLLWLGTRLSAGLLLIAQGFSSFPWATWEIPGPTVAVMLLWWSGLLGFVLLRGRWRLVSLATPLAAVLHLMPAAPDAQLEVTFLAVGHGDATVVSHRGQHLLIDGGGVPNGVDTGRRFVLPFLRQRRITELELAVLSHAHPDHALGLTSTLESVKARRLWLSPSPPGQLTADLLAAAEPAEVELVERGHDDFVFGDARLRVLGPTSARTGDEGENDRSIVLRLEHGQISFLLTGDIEEGAEEALGALEPVTVVKAPHHGSDTSSTPALVAATRPRFVVFCVGRNNRFRFPREDVVSRWASVGATCYRTDRDGAITFRSDGRTVRVETFGPPADLVRARRSPSRR